MTRCPFCNKGLKIDNGFCPWCGKDFSRRKKTLLKKKKSDSSTTNKNASITDSFILGIGANIIVNLVVTAVLTSLLSGLGLIIYAPMWWILTSIVLAIILGALKMPRAAAANILLMIASVSVVVYLLFVL